MQATSAVWKALWGRERTRLESEAVIDGTAYEISPPRINRALTQEGPSVGNVVSALCQFSLEAEDRIARSAGVAIRMRLAGGDGDEQETSEWLPVGTFYISRRQRDPLTGVTTVECYDALLKANTLWEPGAGAWPRRMWDVTRALASRLGLEIDPRTQLPMDGLYGVDAPETGTTIRDALGAIAAANGGNWIVTPANRLRLVSIVPPEQGDEARVEAVLGNISIGPQALISGVRCRAGGLVTLTGDDSGLVIDVSIAPVIAAELAERLIGAPYRPFTLENALYDPAAELGDAVVYDGDLLGALLSETATLAPGFRGSVGAPDSAELADEYPYIGPNERVTQVVKAAVQALEHTAVSAVTAEYAQGPSAVTPPAQGWSTVAPERVEGLYIWQRIATLYADGQRVVADPVNLTGADGKDGEAGTVLRIDSSRGTVFKNNQVSTVLTVAIYHGSERVTDPQGLRRVFGVGAYLQWRWQRMGEDRYGVISTDDSRISDGGFTFTLSPQDVDTKVTFMCELIVE